MKVTRIYHILVLLNIKNMILIYLATITVVASTYFIFRNKIKNNYARAFFDSNYFIVGLILVMEGIDNVIPYLFHSGAHEISHHSARSFVIIYLIFLAINMNYARKKTKREKDIN